MKKTKIILPALAVILVIGLMVGPAIAYFTAHKEATGAVEVNLGAVTTLIEDPPSGEFKTVRVYNEGPESCYVRVKAVPDTLQEATGDDWTKYNRYYYYTGNQGELAAEQTTGDLTFKVDGLVGGTEGDSFDVTIVYESIRVQYTDDGRLLSPLECDWNATLIDKTPVTTQEGGN